MIFLSVMKAKLNKCTEFSTTHLINPGKQSQKSSNLSCIQPHLSSSLLPELKVTEKQVEFTHTTGKQTEGVNNIAHLQYEKDKKGTTL